MAPIVLRRTAPAAQDMKQRFNLMMLLYNKLRGASESHENGEGRLQQTLVLLLSMSSDISSNQHYK